VNVVSSISNTSISGGGGGAGSGRGSQVVEGITRGFSYGAVDVRILDREARDALARRLAGGGRGGRDGGGQGGRGGRYGGGQGGRGRRDGFGAIKAAPGGGRGSSGGQYGKY
jgi:hypothetical protein